MLARWYFNQARRAQEMGALTLAAQYRRAALREIACDE